MSVWVWVGAFVAASLFWSWVLFWGGAEWLEGSFVSGLLIDWWAPRWSADGIKVFALGTWVLSGLWFVFGLFFPDSRVLWLFG